MPSVTIKDVAAAAGVAESSVSRILSGVPGYTYSEETQARVKDAAERLGYQANTAARLLKQQKKNLVGLAVKLTVHPYLNRLIIAVRDELWARGYEPIFLEPDQLIKPRQKALFPSPELLAGIISLDLSLGQTGSERFANLRREMPMVALYPVDSEDVNWVYTDGAKGIELVVEHLVELGHKRIVFSELPETSYLSDRLKLKGWKNAIERFDLGAEARLITLHPETPVEARASHIVQELSAMEPRPTALICTGDESALCVMGKLQTLGWKIPEDFSIVGYDGIDFGAYSCPPLTTVEQPVAEIARLGVLRLLEIVEQRHEEAVPRQQMIVPTLLIRGSTSPLTQST